MKEDIEREPGLRDLRCCCGSLVARIAKNHIEIKCRRCKRIHRIPIEGGAPAAPDGEPGRMAAGPLRGGKAEPR